MSDEESDRHSALEEDDLFGDDDQEIEESNAQSKLHGNSDEDSEGSGNEQLDLDEEAPLKTIQVSLPRHAAISETEPDSYLLRVPVFLKVEPHPFDPTEFKEAVDLNAQARLGTSKEVNDAAVVEKLINENTIRWRYSNTGNDEIVKQTNAHFVRWSDGLISFKVGDELFDFKELPVTDQFLARAHDSQELLQNDLTITKLVSLLPASSLSSTHRRLTQAVKTVQRKGKILNTITEGDPLMKQRIADETERKTLKLKRQLELKRRLQEERLERSSSSHSYPALRSGAFEPAEPAYERFARTYGDEKYDEEDGFVANDEEEVESFDEEDEEDEEDDVDDDEEEKRAERLRALKQAGAAKYSNLKKPEPEQIAEEKTARKRRRILDSDEDDE